LAKLFGFVQFDFAGTLPLADGRYLVGEPESGEETVLVLQRLGAPALGERRRRRRPAPAEPDPAAVAITRATVIRAASPFEERAQAARWLDESSESEEAIETLADEAIAIFNRALHAQAVAAADPRIRQVSPEEAERVVIGYGSGEETSESRFTDARQVDAGPRTASRRRQREEQLRPQERVSALLRGREQLDACETLLLRARADLDAGRTREAALQLRVGLEALLTELDGAVDDPDHEKDIATLREQQTSEQQGEIEETLAIAERILRRRRVLGG
jgi:hypothetical protein